MKAGYLEWDNSKLKFVNAIKGVPQGGIVSPILSNLLLHELDIYIEKIQEELDTQNTGKSPYLKNPIYHRISMRIHRLKKKIEKNAISEENKHSLILEYKKLIKERRNIKSLNCNPSSLRLDMWDTLMTG